MQQINKTKKAEYDKMYRQINKDKLKAKKKAWFEKDYALNPEKYRRVRALKLKKHLDYCRQPHYKEYKKAYDRKRRFGDYEECQSLMSQIFKIVKEHYPDPYERRKARGYYQFKTKKK